MKRISVMTIFLLSCLAVAAQQPAPPSAPQVVTPKTPYDSTQAKLHVANEDKFQAQADSAQAKLQLQLKDLQAQWQAEEVLLNAWVAKVKEENKWDDTYIYDRMSDRWMHTPKPEAKPAETPKR